MSERVKLPHEQHVVDLERLKADKKKPSKKKEYGLKCIALQKRAEAMFGAASTPEQADAVEAHMKRLAEIRYMLGHARMVLIPEQQIPEREAERNKFPRTFEGAEEFSAKLAQEMVGIEASLNTLAASKDSAVRDQMSQMQQMIQQLQQELQSLKDK